MTIIGPITPLWWGILIGLITTCATGLISWQKNDEPEIPLCWISSIVGGVLGYLILISSFGPFPRGVNLVSHSIIIVAYAVGWFIATGVVAWGLEQASKRF